MNGGLAPGEFWVASGHLLCDRDGQGRVVATEALWRAFLARPELMPPEEACDAERALHARLLGEPLRRVEPAEIAALADADAHENWQVFLAFRDRVAREATLEAAYLRLFREGVAGIPPLFLQMLTHLVMRAALDGVGDPQVLRAGFYVLAWVEGVGDAIVTCGAGHQLHQTQGPAGGHGSNGKAGFDIDQRMQQQGVDPVGQSRLIDQSGQYSACARCLAAC